MASSNKSGVTYHKVNANLDKVDSKENGVTYNDEGCDSSGVPSSNKATLPGEKVNEIPCDETPQHMTEFELIQKEEEEE